MIGENENKNPKLIGKIEKKPYKKNFTAMKILAAAVINFLYMAYIWITV